MEKAYLVDVSDSGFSAEAGNDQHPSFTATLIEVDLNQKGVSWCSDSYVGFTKEEALSVLSDFIEDETERTVEDLKRNIEEAKRSIEKMERRIKRAEEAAAFQRKAIEEAEQRDPRT